MPKLTKETIESLIDLCRIECSETEQEALLNDLEKILAYIDQLNDINTDNVSARSQVVENNKGFMREDRAGQSMPRELFLSNVPSHAGGLVRVPPILKSN